MNKQTVYAATVERTYREGDTVKKRVTLVGNYRVGQVLSLRTRHQGFTIIALVECGSHAGRV